MRLTYALATLLPVLVAGGCDAPTSDAAALAFPEAYYHGQAGLGLQLRKLLTWVATAAWHASCVYFVTMRIWSEAAEDGTGSGRSADSAMDGISSARGDPPSLEVIGTALYLQVVLVAQLKLLVEIHSISALQARRVDLAPRSDTRAHLPERHMRASPGAPHARISVSLPLRAQLTSLPSPLPSSSQLLATLLGLLSWVLFECLATAAAEPTLGCHGAFLGTVSSPLFWLSMPLVSAAALLPDVAWYAYRTHRRPTLLDYLRRIDTRLSSVLELADADGGAAAASLPSEPSRAAAAATSAGGRCTSPVLMVASSSTAASAEAAATDDHGLGLSAVILAEASPAGTATADVPPPALAPPYSPPSPPPAVCPPPAISSTPPCHPTPLRTPLHTPLASPCLRGTGTSPGALSPISTMPSLYNPLDAPVLGAATEPSSSALPPVASPLSAVSLSALRHMSIAAERPHHLSRSDTHGSMSLCSTDSLDSMAAANGSKHGSDDVVFLEASFGSRSPDSRPLTPEGNKARTAPETSRDKRRLRAELLLGEFRREMSRMRAQQQAAATAAAGSARRRSGAAASAGGASVGGAIGGTDGRLAMHLADAALSPIWLRFTSDATLEATFCRVYSRYTMRRMRSPTCFALTTLVGVGCWQLANPPASASSTAAALVSDPWYALPIYICLSAALALGLLALAVGKTPFLQDHLHEVLAVVGAFSSLAARLVASGIAGGFSSLHFFPMVFAVLLRLRFSLALPLCLFDVAVYVSWWGATAAIGRLEIEEQAPDASQLALVLFVWTLVAAVCLHGNHASERAARQDFLLQVELRSSRKTARAMLDNMLPAHVAERLQSDDSKHHGMVLASTEACVSVLFVELCDFHTIVAKLAPNELLTLLDTVWSQFDRLSERHGVTKMETVGGVYMAVGGLDMPASYQAVELTRMAFECIDVISQVASLLTPSDPF